MHSNIALTKKMLTYGRVHALGLPKVSTVAPQWGKGKQVLAWRVSGHLKSHGKKIAQTANHTEQLDRYFFPETKHETAVRIAIGELGTHETPYGSNDGERVNYYQSFTGAYNAAWCASFVTSCLVRAGFRLPSFNKAYVPSWHSTASAGAHNLKSINRLLLQPGDAVCLWKDQHIELFEKWLIKGVKFSCIGGNTSVAGKNSNGGMVCRTTRYVTEISCACRVV